MCVTPFCAKFHQFWFDLQELIVANRRVQRTCMAGCGDLYGFRYLGDQAVKVEGGQKRDIALFLAEQVRHAREWMEVGVTGVRPQAFRYSGQEFFIGQA